MADNEKVLIKGNEAIAEAAVRAGCRGYFGYPITPQNEVPEYMSRRLPEVGGVFVQAESELASINMVYGATAAGVRAMTSSSSPGISLMQEGISYIAGAETPAVIMNMMRGGPGLGNIAPSQADYLQATKGGGHGDYNLIVFAPSTVQEIVDIVYNAFDVAFKYRNPVMILADGIMGQISEAVSMPPMRDPADIPDWALGNGKNRAVIKSLRLSPDDALAAHNKHLQEKLAKIRKEVVQSEEYKCDDADYVVVAYGTPARITKTVVDALREEGLKVGLFRPITIWPFPYDALKAISDKMSSKPNAKIFVAEMAQNQLEQDVRMAVEGKVAIDSFNRLGGVNFDEEDLFDFIKKSVK
jgi:2-oxoglutarate ferredoxin oxidoreductase subunit alpha